VLAGRALSPLYPPRRAAFAMLPRRMVRAEAGGLDQVCAVGMANAGGYYHYGAAGPQVVRCVRGTGVVKMVKGCTMAQGCKDW
jgi:hypothetical protein